MTDQEINNIIGAKFGQGANYCGSLEAMESVWQRMTQDQQYWFMDHLVDAVREDYDKINGAGALDMRLLTVQIGVVANATSLQRATACAQMLNSQG